MDDNFKVVWDKVAELELDAITQYISDQGAPIAALKLEEKIQSYADKLSFSPYRVFYDREKCIRKCNVGEYMILFKVYENTNPKLVFITQIIHGRRNLRKWVRR